jgi:hypothetical protein
MNYLLIILFLQGNYQRFDSANPVAVARYDTIAECEAAGHAALERPVVFGNRKDEWGATVGKGASGVVSGMSGGGFACLPLLGGSRP